jgi:DNA replication protein DnaC
MFSTSEEQEVENLALTRRLKAAKLKGAACVEDIDYCAARGLDKAVIRALAKDSAWVRNHENIFVIGPCGVGKSFIAMALAQKACRDGYSALYLRAAALSRELALARADGSLRHLLARLARIDVLVIDDWAMAPLRETERREVWEICEDRYQTRSPSSLPSCRSRAGTSRSAIPPSPTESSIAWCTMPIASRCGESPCARNAIRLGRRATRKRSES